MFLHSWHPSAIAFSIGSFELHWYGIMLGLGALAGYYLSIWLAKQRRLKIDHVTNVILWLIPAGLIGGRLYHVANEWAFYRLHANEIFSIWNGGLGIHGAIIAGIIVLWLYTQKHKLDVWKLLDVLTPGFALGQAIGRWGNYFNQELFGRPTSLPWGIPIDPEFRPANYQTSNFFHPAFLYESLGNLLIVGVLIWLHRKSPQRGVIALTYFILYAVLRIIMEMIRIDRTPIVAGIRLPIIVSALIIIAVVVIYFRFNESERSKRTPVKSPLLR
jgi:phosphatidylglycerol:prolipoprotein diacylglycerol transferase